MAANGCGKPGCLQPGCVTVKTMTLKRTPFDSIESSLEYVSLLHEAIEKTRKAVGADAAMASAEGAARRLEALQLVLYKLERLDKHMASVHRILNDLRTLRRLLLGERVG